MPYVKRAVLILAFVFPLVAGADWPWSSFPTPQFPTPARYLPVVSSVPGFSVTENGIAFSNYSIWAGSKWPAFLQVPHCTGLALLVRQVFLHAVFLPDEPAVSNDVMEKRLRKIFKRDATAVPNTLAKVKLPGFRNLYELSQAPGMEDAIKNVLGNALTDALRSDWNWSPVDAFNRNVEKNMQANQIAQITIASGRPVIFYLTHGTESAHAVLAFAYIRNDEDGSVDYLVYDSASPSKPWKLHFEGSDAQVHSTGLGLRDLFILYPYADQEYL